MAISLNGASIINGLTTGSSIALNSVTVTTDDTVLVGVWQRDETVSISVSDSQSYTWTEIANVDNVQNQCGVSLWRAKATNTGTTNITVTITGNTSPAGAIAQAFSGTDSATTDGVEAFASTTGPSTDDNDMLFSVTTLTDDAWAVAMGCHRISSFTVPGSDTGPVSINATYGTGGESVLGSMWYEGPVNPAASTQLGDLNDLASNRDWCMIVVSLKPAGGGPVEPTLKTASESVPVGITTDRLISSTVSRATTVPVGLSAAGQALVTLSSENVETVVLGLTDVSTVVYAIRGEDTVPVGVSEVGTISTVTDPQIRIYSATLALSGNVFSATVPLSGNAASATHALSGNSASGTFVI